ncbi:MAG: hypothetical protein ABI954_08935 [Pyrinomonadaceae bacterium]
MAEGLKYELTRREFRKNAITLYGAWSAPVLLALPLPIIFLILFFLFGVNPPTAALYLFLAIISAGAGFLLGIVTMLLLFWYRNNWLKNLREQLAADGIKTSEVDWFTNELTTAERKSLREMERMDRLLADAFRETLASRLTATRILKNSKNELLLVNRRQNKLKYLQSENTKSLKEELADDKKRLELVRDEAQGLLTESKTRLEMIEAAARRGTALAGNEQALKLLSERSAQLPMALESARLEDEVRRELEAEEALK